MWELTANFCCSSNILVVNEASCWFSQLGEAQRKWDPAASQSECQAAAGMLLPLGNGQEWDMVGHSSQQQRHCQEAETAHAQVKECS